MISGFEINTQMLLVLQLIADAVVCLSVVALFILLRREGRKKLEPVNDKSLCAFKELLDESNVATAHLIDTMNDSRKSLTELVASLDDRERRIRAILKEIDDRQKTTAPNYFFDDDDKTRRYEMAKEMKKQGFSVKEICERLDLTDGEIELVFNLDFTKPAVS